MTAPFSVDPAALAGTGRSVGGEGDAIASAVGSLDSALSGAGALFGHDAAGLVFGQSYTASGNAVLQAAASAVNATRRVGFGVQTSAANYGHANASSAVGGGAAPVEVPSAPTQFSAPDMPPPLGGGIAAPWGWSLVEAFVGDVWPDGDPAKMRAAASAWRSFGTTVGGLAGEVTATGFGLGAQQIPEAGPMAHAMGQIEAGLAKVATEAQAVATTVDGFASAVDSTQDAVRGLLHQLSPSGILDAIGGIFTGHDPMDEVRKIAHEIKTVLDNMKREADASGQIFSQGINSLDSATNSLETWANKEFTSVFGQDVGGALSFGFNAAVEQSEGALKFVAVTAQGLGQLDPTRFAYDPKGASETWGKAAEGLSTMLNPATLIQKVVTDPSGSLDTLKGVVDWKDVEDGHPFRALGYNEAQIATAFIPGVGEAEPAIDGASVVGRTASAEERAAAGAARDGVPEVAGATSASETITGQAGHVASELDGVKVPESTVPGAAPGESAPAGRAPVDTTPAPAETPTSRPPVDTPPRAETAAPSAHESGPAPRGPEGSSPPAPESTAPVGPRDVEPVPPHADSSPPHASEPAPSAAAPAEASAPAAGGSHGPGVAAAEPTPAGVGGSNGVDPSSSAQERVTAGVGAHGGESSDGALGTGQGSGGPDHETGGGPGHDASNHSDSHGDHGPSDHADSHGHHENSGGGTGDTSSSPWDQSVLSQEQRDEIVEMGKGARPDPSDYLPQEFIDHHLGKFDDGATRFMIEKNYDMYGIGQRDGTTFVMPTNEVDALIKSAGGDPTALARSLGLPEDYFLSDGVIRIDVPVPQDYDLRVPSGNEAGANDYWLPGGFLPDGVSEAVIDGGAIPESDFSITEVPNMKADE